VIGWRLAISDWRSICDWVTIGIDHRKIVNHQSQIINQSPITNHKSANLQ
jgi:hypothetical protein